MTRPAQLNRYEIELLEVGSAVPVDVCDERGIVLVPALTVLDERQLKLVKKRCLFEFFSSREWPTQQSTPQQRPPASGPGDSNIVQAESANFGPPAADPNESGSLTFDVSVLRLGMRIGDSLYDDRGVKLLNANTTVTPRFLELLRQRELENVVIKPEDPEQSLHRINALETTLTQRLDALSESLQRVDAVPQGTNWFNRQELSPPKLQAKALEQLAHYQNAVSSFERNARQLLRGGLESINETRELLNTFVDSIALDAGIIPYLLRLQRIGGEYLFHHALNASLLSMAIAAGMGYSRKQAFELGVAALLHDLGMLKVADTIRLAPRSLTADEFLQVQYHPIHTLNLLESTRDVEELAMFVAYQVHERWDGSGYPRNRKKVGIHPYARIIAIADCYCAMICPRPYRRPMRAYDSVEAILGQTKFGYFDPKAVRALLDCIGLFPVGSVVSLSNDQTARVVRAHAGQYSQPTVMVLDDQGQDTGEALDLREQSDLCVTRVVE